MSSPPRTNRGIPQVPPAPRKPKRTRNELNLNEEYYLFRLGEQPRIVEQKKITVKDVTGRIERYTVDLETEAVYTLKNEIYDRLELNKEVVKLMLVVNGKELKDDYITLQEAGVREGAQLNLIVQMKTGRGGTRRKGSNKRKTRKH